MLWREEADNSERKGDYQWVIKMEESVVTKTEVMTIRREMKENTMQQRRSHQEGARAVNWLLLMPSVFLPEFLKKKKAGKKEMSSQVL
jgi:alkyl sulfatase BDS1-like metallo-beta-lactamase superfamily hydrolase